MLKMLIVAFDGSIQSYRAFDFALDLAGTCSGAVHKIVVLSIAQPPEPIDIVEMDAVIDNATRHYEDLFKALREKAKERGVEIKTEVMIGHPAEQIIKYAAENKCDMVIMGQKGKSKIESWLLGSVSKRVATHCHCTVTIVK
ncbi:MAG: universal stress protein [Nitrospirae bacterium]|nr:universal stress protein [Nitrospirota bacterium]